jgi:hypothetical protein
MAQATGKKFSHWNDTNSSKSYLSVLSHKAGIPASELVQIRKGGLPEEQGTWGHPKVAIRFAQWCSDDFAVQVDSWVDELITTGSVSLTPTAQVPYFYRRIATFHEKTGRIPDGYFCIFLECLQLVSELERHGYQLPDDGAIDVSIGLCFCGYLRKELGIEPDDVCKKYPHHYPNSRKSVPANLYPFELLPEFRSWMQKRYYQHNLPKYIKGKKDPQAIEAVGKFLGLLEGC